jgi:trans-aconitate 2-methyltransferase
MPTWDADQYLRFNEQRTRPCRELAERVAIDAPRQVIDLGCGPGNSTAVLVKRWPAAEVRGLDSSAEMIAKARRDNPAMQWLVGDISKWVAEAGESFDVVFSNAAMQWVEDHASVFATLMQRLASGGALAMQMPGNFDAPAHVIMREIAESAQWRSRFPQKIREWHVHDLPFYYDVLAPLAKSVDFWETEYLHVLPDAAGIVEWYKGTGLRPFLDLLGNDAERSEFTKEYLQRIAVEYPQRADGRVIFPFRRLFMVAYR